MTAPGAWQAAARRLTAALHLDVAPIAITFSEIEGGAPPFVDHAAPMPGPTPDARTGQIAKEQHRPAASVGCALSRARTGLGAQKMTCALPGSRLDELVTAIESAAAVDGTVARYAAADAKRFAVLS